MRILSKFHDYYDSAQGYGQDRTPVFVRKSQQFVLGTDDVPTQFQFFIDFAEQVLPVKRSFTTKLCHHIGEQHGLVLFAGRLFPYAEISATFRDRTLPDQMNFVYRHDDVARILAALGHSPKGGNDSFPAWETNPTQIRANFFALSKSEALRDRAVEAKEPILLYRREPRLLDVSFCLQGIEFARCLPPYDAFQELSMFMGNVASPEKETVSITDKDRVVQHGFDEWSFRKLPTKVR